MCPSQKENAIQWIWLENKLKDSNSSVQIAVSPIRVQTTNAAVESWGHFPAEQK